MECEWNRCFPFKILIFHDVWNRMLSFVSAFVTWGIRIV
jgi:hypothetical protein